MAALLLEAIDQLFETTSRCDLAFVVELVDDGLVMVQCFDDRGVRVPSAIAPDLLGRPFPCGYGSATWCIHRAISRIEAFAPGERRDDPEYWLAKAQAVDVQHQAGNLPPMECPW